MGEEAVPKGIPRTIENQREEDEFIIKDFQDEDIRIEELNDNYAAYADKVSRVIDNLTDKIIFVLRNSLNFF